ncbi:transcriptional regulator [Latilactobacillus curvatus]|uniref:Transcriptional regulator n=1 Tax=Latilactobacillus curvatus TaxID=28038 RepID=A0A385AF94_LATCU|nr:ArpU family phage packaging/lysis transcriptional regulator [Latilactobacillus curvatus]AXN36268.1 transcriptional regulator [Latilactobacillus curvatus]AZP96011.1 transcriptional regulator [Latilactobacillus curvatus]MCT1216000.1 transcriptional regulator [Latilactobacillus curvatus]UTC10195.1 hypothetical protein A4W79_02645 [Latilactobacillus curvatus]UTC14783.1 hypothetical protein A4W80_07640 [Latilactobacillus curvatus]
MSKLFNFDINEAESRQRAMKFLKRYWRIRHIAGNVSHLKSPSYNHTPKSHNNENGQETRTIKAIEAQQVIDNIESALACLTDEHARLLRLTYMNATKLTTVNISINLGMGESMYKYHKAVALVEFAEAYPTGELLIYRK